MINFNNNFANYKLNSAQSGDKKEVNNGALKQNSSFEGLAKDVDINKTADLIGQNNFNYMLATGKIKNHPHQNNQVVNDGLNKMFNSFSDEVVKYFN